MNKQNNLFIAPILEDIKIHLESCLKNVWNHFLLAESKPFHFVEFWINFWDCRQNFRDVVLGFCKPNKVKNQFWKLRIPKAIWTRSMVLRTPRQTMFSLSSIRVFQSSTPEIVEFIFNVLSVSNYYCNKDWTLWMFSSRHTIAIPYATQSQSLPYGKYTHEILANSLFFFLRICFDCSICKFWIEIACPKFEFFLKGKKGYY